jgi:hypothetical protein
MEGSAKILIANQIFVIHMSKLQAKNEAIINAPISTIWAVIADIDG